MRRSYLSADELYKEIISDPHCRLITKENPPDLYQMIPYEPIKIQQLDNGYWDYQFKINNDTEREFLNELRYAPFREIKLIPLMEVQYQIDENNKCMHSCYYDEDAKKLNELFPLDYRAKLAYDLIVNLLKKETS